MEPLAYISFPTIAVADSQPEDTERDTVAPDPWHDQLVSAFFREENRALPPTSYDRPFASDYVEAAVRELAAVHGNAANPQYFIDCRSSAPIGGPAPTYSVVKDLGLVDSLPVTLTGQGGSEFATAVMLFGNLTDVSNEVSVVSTSHKSIVAVELRQSSFPFGEGAAAVLVAKNAMFQSGFAVATISCGQCEGTSNSDRERELEKLWTDISRIGTIADDSLDWVITQRSCADFLPSVMRVIRSNTWLVRSKFPDINYGAADVLVTLHDALKSDQIPHDSCGALCLQGNSGSLALVLLCRLPAAQHV